MLDYHSRSVTETWPQPLTWRPAFDGVDATATTMAQPTVAVTARPAAAPSYAWSAEVPAEDPAPAKRSHGLVRPMAVAGIVAAAAAAAATALIAFGGQASSPAVSTSTVSTPIAANHVAAPAPAPTAAPAAPAPVSRHRPSYSQPASTTYQEPAHTSTSSDQNSESQQHGDQWRPWHDTTQHTSNWNFFRPHFDFPDHHDRDHDRSGGHGDQQSSERHSYSSSHGSE